MRETLSLFYAHGIQYGYLIYNTIWVSILIKLIVCSLFLAFTVLTHFLTGATKSRFIKDFLSLISHLSLDDLKMQIRRLLVVSY